MKIAPAGRAALAAITGLVLACTVVTAAGAAPSDPTATRIAAHDTAVAVAAGQPEPDAGGILSPCNPGSTHRSPRTGRFFDGNGVRIHTGPHLRCTTVGEGFRNQTATLYCFTTGDSVFGDPFWDRLKDDTTGKRGYSSEVFLVIVPLTPC